VILSVFLPVVPVNSKNQRESNWTRSARVQRHRWLAWALYRTWVVPPGWGPTVPKVVRFEARLHNRMDEQDGLRVACAPFLDALQLPAPAAGKRAATLGVGLIDHDGPDCGHTFLYGQRIERTKSQQGVLVTVGLLGPAIDWTSGGGDDALSGRSR
jgi:hypothetical protein